MTDADRIAALEDKIGRLERVVESVLQRELERSNRGIMEAVRATRSRPLGEGMGYTRDTNEPFTEAEIARMTGENT